MTLQLMARRNLLAVLRAATKAMAAHAAQAPWHLFDAHFGRRPVGRVPNADGQAPGTGPVDSYKVRISATLFAAAARGAGDTEVEVVCLGLLRHFRGDCAYTVRPHDATPQPAGHNTVLAGPDGVTLELVGQRGLYRSGRSESARNSHSKASV
jgi:hypothetical protein